MDSESADSRTKGCWDPVPFFKPFLQQWTSATPTPDFRPSQDWLGACTGLGFGSASTAENTDFWNRTITEVYKGDEGRRKLRMATICLAERDGLLLRLDYIRCPVHWLQVRSVELSQGRLQRIPGSNGFVIRVLKMLCTRRKLPLSRLHFSLLPATPRWILSRAALIT